MKLLEERSKRIDELKKTGRWPTNTQRAVIPKNHTVWEGFPRRHPEQNKEEFEDHIRLFWIDKKKQKRREALKMYHSKHQ